MRNEDSHFVIRNFHVDMVEQPNHLVRLLTRPGWATDYVNKPTRIEKKKKEKKEKKKKKRERDIYPLEIPPPVGEENPDVGGRL